jgi:hypothetical protein
MSFRETQPEEYLNGGGAGRGRNPLLSTYLLFFQIRMVLTKPNIPKVLRFPG